MVSVSASLGKNNADRWALMRNGTLMVCRAIFPLFRWAAAELLDFVFWRHRPSVRPKRGGLTYVNSPVTTEVTGFGH